MKLARLQYLFPVPTIHNVKDQPIDIIILFNLFFNLLRVVFYSFHDDHLMMNEKTHTPAEASNCSRTKKAMPSPPLVMFADPE